MIMREMKHMTCMKRVGALALGLIFASGAMAQDKIEANVSADVVSQY